MPEMRTYYTVAGIKLFEMWKRDAPKAPDMTDHYINAELCRDCPVKRICSALVADGSWNPYLAVVPGGPCQALVRPSAIKQSP